MAATTINESIEKLQSDRLRERIDGVSDLKRIFQQKSRGGPEVLNDKGYHKICEALFRSVSVEKASYVKSSSVTARAQSASRLSACSSALRSVVEAGVSKIRSKTVRAILDHIIETLPIAHEGLCEPLALDYLKSMRTVLEYQAHTEHLFSEHWQKLVDFCLSSIQILCNHPNSTIDTSLQGSIHGSRNLSLLQGRHGSIASPTAPSPSKSNGSNISSKSNMEEIILCLEQLVTAPNMPVIDRDHVLLTGLVQFLRSQVTVSRAHQGALAAINSILRCSVTESIPTTRHAVQEMLPLLRTLWWTKSTSLKDEILINITITQTYIEAILRSADSSTFRSDVQSLFETIFEEYTRRPSRDWLHLEDIDFLPHLQSGKVSFEPFKMPTFRLKTVSSKATSAWLTLQCLAFLVSHLDMSEAAKRPDSGEPPNKRQRVEVMSVEALGLLRTSDQDNKIAGLQTWSLFPETMRVSDDDLQSLLKILLSNLSDKSPNVVSWSMMVLTRLTQVAKSAERRFSEDWTHAWQLASRSITSPLTCHSGCALMSIIVRSNLCDFNAMSDSVESIMSSIEVNGPAIVVDSALAYLTSVLDLVAGENPTVATRARESVQGWFHSRWNPGKMIVKSSMAHNTRHSNPVAIMNFLYTCYGLKPPFRKVEHLPYSGRLGAEVIEHFQKERFMKFLLLLPNEDEVVTMRAPKIEEMSYEFGPAKPAMHPRALRVMSASLSKAAEASAEIFTTLSSISSEQMKATLSLYIISGYLTVQARQSGHETIQELDHAMKMFTGFTSKALDQSKGDQNLREAAFDILSELFPLLEDCCWAQFNNNNNDEWVFDCLNILIDSLSFPRDLAPTDGESCVDDLMDIDESRLTQDVRERPVLHTKPRRSILFQNSQPTFHQIMILQLYGLITSVSNYGEDARQRSTLPQYVLTLKAADLMFCGSYFVHVCSFKDSIPSKDAERVLTHVASELLQPYEFERSEVAMDIILDLLHFFVPFVSCNNSTDDLVEKSAELCEWFVEVGVGKRISSQPALLHVANLIYYQGEQGPVDSSQAQLQGLLKALQIGDAFSKNEIMLLIAKLFSSSTFRDHEMLYDEVLACLPSDADWEAGMAVRLSALTRMGINWPSVLRQSVFHIFEASHAVPETADVVKRCFEELSGALSMKTPQNLFHFFSNQLLHTWLEGHALLEIPYSVFGFESRTKLLQEIQDEAVAQLMLRSDEAQLTLFARSLGFSVKDAVLHSFGRAMAYCIAGDISSSSRSQDTRTREQFLRNVLGTELFISQVQSKLISILALLLSRSDGDEHFLRAFAKSQRFENAYKIFNAITSLACSTRELPPSQQPSFRSRYLFREIEHLCKRAGFDPAHIWSPSSLTCICGSLFDSIDLALGSLHTCDIIRKVRIVISLADSVSTEGYPLEMILRRLEPFLEDPYCAEDTFGIFQYLLTRGRDHLVQMPDFLGGTILCALVSLRKLLDYPKGVLISPHEFEHVKTGAGSLFEWMQDYVNDVSVQSPSQSFRAILNVGERLQFHDNAFDAESSISVLRLLVSVDSSSSKLLDKSVQNVIIDLLSHEVEQDANFGQQFIDSQLETLEIISQKLWKIGLRGGLSRPLLAWAGRMLGRSFSSSGAVDMAISRETASLLLRHEAVQDDNLDTASKTALLLFICDMLQDPDQAHVGLGECTLRSIFLRVSSREEMIFLESALPPSIILAFKSENDSSSGGVMKVAGPETIAELRGAMDNSSGLLRVKHLSLYLTKTAANNHIVGSLGNALQFISDAPERLLPYLLHIFCLSDILLSKGQRRSLSEFFDHCFETKMAEDDIFSKAVLSAILYLRSQSIPGETRQAQRDDWLEFHYEQLSWVANKCKMFRTALLFAEIHASKATTIHRRPKTQLVGPSGNLMTEIYEKLDDPDGIYGIEQSPDLTSIGERLNIEKAGYIGLSFIGAKTNSDLRLAVSNQSISTENMVASLESLGQDALAFSLLQHQQLQGSAERSRSTFYKVARRLSRWDLPAPSTHQSNEAALYSIFQSISNGVSKSNTLQMIQDESARMFSKLLHKQSSGADLQLSLGTLAALDESYEVLSLSEAKHLQQSWGRMVERQGWMRTGRLEDVAPILSARESLFSSMHNATAHGSGSSSFMPKDLRLMEIHALAETSKLSRAHEALQLSLNSVTHLSQLVRSSEDLGLKVEALATFEAAKAVWMQGEMTRSIKMLEHLRDNVNLKEQVGFSGKADLLATLGHQVSEARLEKPEIVISDHLSLAVKELKGQSKGETAGKVFHEFASFCDQQLRDSDNLEDFDRVKRLRKRKQAEVQDLDKMLKTAGSQGKSNLQSHRARAKQWFTLDDQEYQRLFEIRKAFRVQSVENYLLALCACEGYDNDVLRFCALWLEQAESEVSDLVNKAVSKQLGKVPSRKFASLMNQLTSRMSDSGGEFQTLLFELIYRICADHPFHGMHHIFMTSKSKGKDALAMSRQSAASKMVTKFRATQEVSEYWVSVHNICICYAKLALEKLEEKQKPGTKVLLEKSAAGRRLQREVEASAVPPPTMRIDIRTDCNYSSVPCIAHFKPEFTVAGGVSVPKIVTAVSTEGQHYKQLVKGGNDDLRQDAIMEQVFEQVSALLRNDRFTRQRDLKIRTYKVLPLTTNAGIIEFVPNTIPLHDYLMPAHQTHFPKDWKPNICRRSIGDVQSRSLDVRLRTYKQVTDHFHPVLRYFFMERFQNPDDWFEKRRAYVRSTAAISILGHVLGLGDRHGHNILLDEETGEVVHIDLGVAFEQGRVLPIPEVVPFRLTRDIVDGMGITGTEGIFRRCCEFTLDALRKESYSIMTVLDVLRYDPLYSWTVSPLRLKKMQEQQSEIDPLTPNAVEAANGARARADDEPSEADRALTVVAKKLSKTLSVTATVNELIQQATDEKNLAVLYCGWAAYA